MPTPQNIFTYLAEMPGGIKRRQLNYQELWQSFKASQSQAALYAEQTRRYDPKMSGSRTGVDRERVDRHYEAELQRINEGGER